GFTWRHRTMEAAEAMAHIEEAFREIAEARWLPQWSFDFWILPYLAGRGIPAEGFKRYMEQAHRLLQLEYAGAAAGAQRTAREDLLGGMVAAAAEWCAGRAGLPVPTAARLAAAASLPGGRPHA